jgi:hypothetical protein
MDLQMSSMKWLFELDSEWRYSHIWDSLSVLHSSFALLHSVSNS